MKNNFDYILLFVVIILIILSNLILAPLSVPFSLARFNTTNYFLIHQMIYGLIPGIILGIIFFKIPLNFLKKLAPILFFLNLLGLIFVFLPKIGSHFKGASRWINFSGINFQPSEVLKLTSILYLGAWLKSHSVNYTSIKGYLSKNRERHYNLKNTLLPFVIFVGVIGIILSLQPDISTLGIVIFVSFLLYFIAGTPVWHSILLILMGLGGLVTLINVRAYRFSRLLVFWKPEIDPQGIGYQIKQALIAVGSGGIWGKGIGMSIQKFGFLPHSMSDSIFAVFAEETGFAGTLILIFLFIIFLWRGLKISKLSDDKFCRLTAIGISSWIVFQAFFNIGSTVGILPLAGIPLPFISYGGSHLVTELIGVGILLNISKHANP